MANIKAVCLRKGIVAGRVATAINEIYLQTDVFDELDIPVTRNSLKEIKSAITPLRRNFRTASQEVQAIDAGVKKMEKTLRGKSHEISRDNLKLEAKEMRTNFRKVLRAGFTDCGASKIDRFDIFGFVGDNSYYADEPQQK
jgi:predicted DNA-binding protein (UPF0278 family)